jgi:hypothetical protein
MKVYYMNDEQEDTIVRVMDDTYDHTFTKTNNNQSYQRLGAQEARVFEVVCPEGSVLYVKKWKGMVMLSYLAQSALENLSQLGAIPLKPGSEPSDS